MDLGLKGKVAMVAGASQGIGCGAAIIRAEGARVNCARGSVGGNGGGDPRRSPMRAIADTQGGRRHPV